MGGNAKADCHKVDRYGRDVCNVYVNDKDVGLAQLDAGRAWWFRRFAHEQPPRERIDYGAARIGLQRIESGYGKTPTRCRRGSGVRSIVRFGVR